MPSSSLLSSRMTCPCCRYPTLPTGTDYEICELCNWEDDGQGDDDASEVRGGPNSDYSLAEARENFNKYRVMYEPGRDQRITGKDSQLEYDTKGHLMEAFARLLESVESERLTLETEVSRLEKALQDETTRQVREFEQRSRGA
jgi:hypothetical protein